MDVEDRIRDTFQPIRNPIGVRTIKGAAGRTRRRRKLSGLAGLAAILVTASIVLPEALPGGHQQSAAATTLMNLASVARSEPVITVGPGQYLYSKTSGQGQTCGPDLTSSGRIDCRWQTTVRETWTANDGSGRIMDHASIDGSFSEIVGPGQMGGSLTESVPPSNPDQLQAFVRARAAQAEQPLDYEMFVVVGDLLRETYSSPVLYSTPGLRSSLFEVAAGLPGVQDLGPTTDAIGRQGIGVAYPLGDRRLALIFDPSTAMIMGSQQVRVDGSSQGPAATAGDWSVYLKVGVVGSVQERP